MDAAFKSNENPTALSVSELPTRKTRAAPRNGPDCRYAHVISQRPSYLSRPFLHGDVDDLDHDDDSDDDAAAAGEDNEHRHDQAWPRYSWDNPAAGHDWASQEPIDEQEIYDLVAPLKDPEHSWSLGQLSVVRLEDIEISPSPALGMPSPDTIVRVSVMLTPTVTHCGLANVLGLGVRLRLERALPPNYRAEVMFKKGTYQQDEQVNKQLSDKERVAAALENRNLDDVMNTMLQGC